MEKFVARGLLALITVTGAVPAAAQTDFEQERPLAASVRDAGAYLREMFLAAAEQMSEEDYKYQPTAEVRSFGRILAHVAASNYTFCATALGEAVPVRQPENSLTRREEIRRVLTESFDYCDAAYSAVADDSSRVIEFMGQSRSPMAVMNFRNYHSMVHYGNVVTYMRLRGKVPPSSQAAPADS